MTHRSRLCAAYVDVPRGSYEATVRFYAALSGLPGAVDAEDSDYTSYGISASGVELAVQAVGDPKPRVHLDIETDDVDAEVARLVGLGATVVAQIHRWVVMADPVGNPFCVVRIQQPDAFAAHARAWG